MIVGAEPGSKADKARTLGVPMLDEEGFLQLIGQSCMVAEACALMPETALIPEP